MPRAWLVWDVKDERPKEVALKFEPSSWLPLLSVVVPALALFMVWLRGRASTFWYLVTENQTALAMRAEQLSGLRLMKGTVPVRSAHALSIHFVNEGAHALEASDFVEPLAIRVDPESRLLDVAPL